MTTEANQTDGLTAEEIAALADDENQNIEPAEQPAETPDTGAFEPPPIIVARVPENAQEIAARLVELEEQAEREFDDGEITAKEYREARAQIAEHREALKWEQHKAELAENFVTTAKQRAWYGEVERFMTTAGKDIAARGEPAVLAFDGYVKRVTGDPDHARLSDRAQLDLARKQFMADFGDGFGGKPAVARRDDWSPDAEAESRDGGSDYASLDRLAETNPAAYEDAISRMSVEEQNRYGL